MEMAHKKNVCLDFYTQILDNLNIQGSQLCISYGYWQLIIPCQLLIGLLFLQIKISKFPRNNYNFCGNCHFKDYKCAKYSPHQKKEQAIFQNSKIFTILKISMDRVCVSAPFFMSAQLQCTKANIYLVNQSIFSEIFCLWRPRGTRISYPLHGQ